VAMAVVAMAVGWAEAFEAEWAAAFAAGWVVVFAAVIGVVAHGAEVASGVAAHGAVADGAVSVGEGPNFGDVTGSLAPDSPRGGTGRTTAADGATLMAVGAMAIGAAGGATLMLAIPITPTPPTALLIQMRPPRRQSLCISLSLQPDRSLS